MQVFIDTNVFLSFFHLTGEDLVELEKLAVLIENKEIELFLPQQVIDETWRNRANKINDSLAPFKKSKFALSFPAYCKSYDEYPDLQKAIKSCEELHSSMVNAITKDIEKRELAADKILKRLFDLAKVTPTTDKLLSDARNRMDIGNPPGKRGSLGDAINWLSFLKASSKFKKSAMVADDSDFVSPLNTDRLADFLSDEWKQTHLSELKFYRKLSAFFKDNFPDINLATELEKDLHIEKLASSSNFAQTHAQIAKLKEFNSFTKKQAEDLALALILNSQVRWIADDEDVHEFFTKLYHDHYLSIFGLIDEMEEILEIPDSEKIIPF